MRTRVSTDTATIVVFDPSRLRHRLDDTADWWSLPEEELQELNAGNVVFLNLGADGVYHIEVLESRSELPESAVEALVANESGRFFIGIGEYTTSAGLEPEAEYGNVFLPKEPGTYMVAASMAEPGRVLLTLSKVNATPQNQFTSPLRIG